MILGLNANLDAVSKHPALIPCNVTKNAIATENVLKWVAAAVKVIVHNPLYVKDIRLMVITVISIKSAPLITVI